VGRSSVAVAICSLIANRKKSCTYYSSGLNYPSRLIFVCWAMAVGTKLLSVPRYKGMTFKLEVGFNIYFYGLTVLAVIMLNSLNRKEKRICVNF
jgi:hypothetical protein